jgi:hypothetical protein
VQRCLSIAIVVANGCGPVVSLSIGRRLGSLPREQQPRLHIVGLMRSLVSPSASILVSLPLCFKLKYFIIYVFLL